MPCRSGTNCGNRRGCSGKTGCPLCRTAGSGCRRRENVEVFHCACFHVHHREVHRPGAVGAAAVEAEFVGRKSQRFAVGAPGRQDFCRGLLVRRVTFLRFQIVRIQVGLTIYEAAHDDGFAVGTPGRIAEGRHAAGILIFFPVFSFLRKRP